MRDNKFILQAVVILFAVAVFGHSGTGSLQEGFAVKPAFAEGTSALDYILPGRGSDVSEIDREIGKTRQELDAANRDLSEITKDFFHSIVQADASSTRAGAEPALERAAAAENAIGMVIGLKGDVRAVLGQSHRNLAKNGFVYEHETITTGFRSNVEILFIDDTIISQGPESSLLLDEYVFDPDDAQKSGLSFNLMQGAFRHVTGRIAEQNPEAVKLESTLSWIGIRGTTTVHVVASMESHGVEEIDAGSNVVVRDSFDHVEIISTPQTIVEVFPDRPMSPQRAMTDVERSFFESIAPAAIEAQAPEKARASIPGLQQAITSMSEAVDRSVSRMGALEGARAQSAGQASGCFPGSASVLMENGESRRFEDVKPGDMVMTYDIGYDKIEARKVLDVYTFDSDHLYIINGHLKTTGGERLLTSSGWKRVSSLEPGDLVMMDRDFVELESIEYQRADLKVYNLHVQDTHNFYVLSSNSGSYLVHNCDPSGGPHGRHGGK